MPNQPSSASHIADYITKIADCTTVQLISKAYKCLPDHQRTSLTDVFLWRFRRISLDLEIALQQSTSQQELTAILPIEERLMMLIHELEFRPNNQDDDLLTIAKQWFDVVSNYLNFLEAISAQGQQIENPYVFGMPLSQHQQIFVGRTEVSERIQRVLIDTIQLPALLYGQRRMGKTSLLKNLGRMLPKDVIFFFVDGQGIAIAKDYAGLLYNISREMIKSAKRYKLALPKISRETLKEDPFSYFNEWLDDVEDTLIENDFEKAVLAIDEFEALEHVINKGRFDAEDVFYFVRYLIQNRDNIEMLLAGSHTFDELPRWANHMVNVKTVKISYLKEREARELIERPIDNYLLQYEPGAIQRVLDITRGHPHLVQLLCYELITLKNTHPSSHRFRASIADVDAAIPRALDKGSFFFIDIQENQVDKEGLEILKYIANQDPEEGCNQATLAKLFSDNLDITLKRLLHRDIIEVEDNHYRFQVELIRHWFALLN